MKKSMLWILVILLSSTISCKEEESPINQDIITAPDVADELYLTNGTERDVLFDANGGKKQLTFVSSRTWKIVLPGTKQKWLNLSSIKGDKGKTTITITVEPNEAYERRETELIILSGSKKEHILISQVQKDAIILSQASYTIGSRGGEITLKVGHNVEIDYDSNVNWIEPITSRSWNNDQLTFKVHANPTYENREGTLHFRSKDGTLTQHVQIYQSDMKGLIVSAPQKIFDANDQTFDIQVNANVDYEIIVPQATWIERVETRSLSSRTIRFHLYENTTTSSRRATIGIKSKQDTLSQKVTITQQPSDCIALAKSHYEIDHTRQWLYIDVNYNVNFDTEINVDWIERYTARSMTQATVIFGIKENTTSQEREGKITFVSKDKHIRQEVIVRQQNKDLSYLVREKEILMEFYQSTLGDQWSDHTNWGSDQPVSTWHGVQVDDDGNVVYLVLGHNNLQGQLPSSLTRLTHLRGLYLYANQLTGEIPASYGKMENLEYVYLYKNQLSGTLPESLSKLGKLKVLSIYHNKLTGNIPASYGNLSELTELNIRENQLSGNLPTSLGKLTNLEKCDLSYNNFYGSVPGTIGNLKSLTFLSLSWNQSLTGKLPASFATHPCWKTCWPGIIEGTRLDYSELPLYGPTFRVKTLNNKSLSDELYARHKLTILFGWLEGGSHSLAAIPMIAELYKQYRDQGVKIIGYCYGWDLQEITKDINYYGMNWDTFFLPDYIDNFSYKIYWIGYPHIFVVDSNGMVVFNSVSDNKADLLKFMKEYLRDR